MNSFNFRFFIFKYSTTNKNFIKNAIINIIHKKERHQHNRKIIHNIKIYISREILQFFNTNNFFFLFKITV